MSADNESSVVSAAASADRESTEAGMGMPEALSGGLGVSSPAAPPCVPITAAVKFAYVRWFDAGPESDDELHAQFDRWLAEVIRAAKNEAWFEGFAAGWAECDDPGAFVNDLHDAKTPSPYRTP